MWLVVPVLAIFAVLCYQREINEHIYGHFTFIGYPFYHYLAVKTLMKVKTVVQMIIYTLPKTSELEVQMGLSN